MNNYIITNNGSFIDEAQHICHSGCNIEYVDLREDEIFHWKYIMRVKLPGGGYRYYYYKPELKNLQATVNRESQQSYQRAPERYRVEQDYARTSSSRRSTLTRNKAAEKRISMMLRRLSSLDPDNLRKVKELLSKYLS